MIGAAQIEVERLFYESGLRGRVEVQALPAMSNVMYILPRRMKGPHGQEESVCLDVILRESEIIASVCLQESGAVLYEREFKPTTVDNAREEAEGLLAWALRS